MAPRHRNRERICSPTRKGQELFLLCTTTARTTSSSTPFSPTLASATRWRRNDSPDLLPPTSHAKCSAMRLRQLWTSAFFSSSGLHHGCTIGSNTPALTRGVDGKTGRHGTTATHLLSPKSDDCPRHLAEGGPCPAHAHHQNACSDLSAHTCCCAHCMRAGCAVVNGRTGN